MGSDDESYTCVFQQEDNQGIKGVKLDKVQAPSQCRLYRKLTERMRNPCVASTARVWCCTTGERFSRSSMICPSISWLTVKHIYNSCKTRLPAGLLAS